MFLILICLVIRELVIGEIAQLLVPLLGRNISSYLAPDALVSGLEGGVAFLQLGASASLSFLLALVWFLDSGHIACHLRVEALDFVLHSNFTTSLPSCLDLRPELLELHSDWLISHPI